MIIEYDPETGFISQIVSDPVRPEVADAYANGTTTILNLEPYIINPDAPEEEHEYAHHECEIDLDYIKDGAITKRPHFNLPASVSLSIGEEQTFTGLPVNCTVTTDEGSASIPDGELTIAGEMVATYRLRFSHFPYIEHDMEVTVHAA